MESAATGFNSVKEIENDLLHRHKVDSLQYFHELFETVKATFDLLEERRASKEARPSGEKNKRLRFFQDAAARAFDFKVAFRAYEPSGEAATDRALEAAEEVQRRALASAIFLNKPKSILDSIKRSHRGAQEKDSKSYESNSRSQYTKKAKMHIESILGIAAGRITDGVQEQDVEDAKKALRNMTAFNRVFETFIKAHPDSKFMDESDWKGSKEKTGSDADLPWNSDTERGYETNSEGEPELAVDRAARKALQGLRVL